MSYLLLFSVLFLTLNLCKEYLPHFTRPNLTHSLGVHIHFHFCLSNASLSRFIENFCFLHYSLVSSPSHSFSTSYLFFLNHFSYPLPHSFPSFCFFHLNVVRLNMKNTWLDCICENRHCYTHLCSHKEPSIGFTYIFLIDWFLWCIDEVLTDVIFSSLSQG